MKVTVEKSTVTQVWYVKWSDGNGADKLKVFATHGAAFNFAENLRKKVLDN